MVLQGVTAVRPDHKRSAQTAEEAFSWLKWLEEQSIISAKQGFPSDSLRYLANIRDAARAYKLFFPEHRISFSLIASEAERLRVS